MLRRDAVTICDHIPERSFDVVTICDLKESSSCRDNRKAKSSGKRVRFRRIAWFSAFVLTP